METTHDETVLIARLDEAAERWRRIAKRNRLYKAASQAFWGSAALAIMLIAMGV